LEERPKTAVGIWQLGGAMAKVSADATSYGSRKDPWMVNVDSCWEVSKEDDMPIEFTRSSWKKLQSVSSGKCICITRSGKRSSDSDSLW